jgi:hypothetical protein
VYSELVTGVEFHLVWLHGGGSDDARQFHHEHPVFPWRVLATCFKTPHQQTFHLAQLETISA